MNLVFIIFDDLRPELSVYGRQHMITPNFERLASRSVVFDKAVTQIAVCNPARDSLLTGLRPDTVGTYSFQSSFRPHLVFQNQLVSTGYSTAGYGKIAHWEGDDKSIWNSGSFEGGWYEYQNKERNFMNSSTMPDKVWKEEQFRDYMFTTKAIAKLDEMITTTPAKKFMLAIGFKNPHLQIHIPYAYYDMYKNRTDAFKMTKKELRFPHSAPDAAYRCCAEPSFMYMEQEGAVKSQNRIDMGDINMVFTDKMREELMIGYCAAITYVDVQLGRLLDVMDKHDAWKNTVVILTADHGMHNGEKGIWEKWSMYDESTRVPLFIAHPDSPFKGQHYPDPVETIDIYPTITDLLELPWDQEKYCVGELHFGKKKVCHNMQGKSLAKVVVGTEIYEEKMEKNQHHLNNLVRGTKLVKRVNPRTSGSSVTGESGGGESGSLTKKLNVVPVHHHHHHRRQLEETQDTKQQQQQQLRGGRERGGVEEYADEKGSMHRTKQHQSSSQDKDTPHSPSSSSLFIQNKDVHEDSHETLDESEEELDDEDDEEVEENEDEDEDEEMSHISKTTLNFYYNQWHMSDTNTNSTTLPYAVARYFNGDNYFYLSSVSFHTTDDHHMSTLSSSLSAPPSDIHLQRHRYANETPSNRILSATTTSSSSSSSSSSAVMPKLDMTFALSQSWRCARIDLVKKAANWYKDGANGKRPRSNWMDCDKTRNPDDEVAVMGYSMRTPEYRYTAWFHYNRKLCLPILDVAPFDEELYDHRGEKFEDFTHLEISNLVRRTGYEQTLVALRMKLTDFIKNKILFRGCFKDGD